MRLAPDGRSSRTFADDEVFSLTDLFSEYANEDRGIVVVRRNGRTLLTKSLRGFLDLHEHFAAPIVFEPGSTLSLRVTCANPTRNGSDVPCSAAVYASGFTRAPSL